MLTSYTSSVNIIRDENRQLVYIPTPNSTQVVDKVCNEFKKGLRSFNIIGSYGTGKSSFLWAFQQSMKGDKDYFDINLLPDLSYAFINLIGEYRSLKDVLAERFAVKNDSHVTENIFSQIYNAYHDLGKGNKVLFLVIDEFGKFLEYASQNEPEKELYFIQQLAEFINTPENNIVWFTTVHQNFDAYAFSLSGSQRQEWTKVKGRFREIGFNEPVEQLLFLAAEHLKMRLPLNTKRESTNKAFELFLSSQAFHINSGYARDVTIHLYPLDIFAATILTLSLQRYGQNERSLFSFFESEDLSRIDESFINLASIYDYLIYNYYSFINSKHNPDYSEWRLIKSTLEKVDRSFEQDFDAYGKIIKSIGLLKIFSASGSILDRKFLQEYSALCLDVPQAKQLLESLEKRKIILYQAYHKRFVLFEGSSVDIQLELIKAGNKVEQVVDVTTLLNKYYKLPPVIAKEISYKDGTPRLFEYIISEEPNSSVPKGEIDGFINLIFNDRLSIDDIIKDSKNQLEAILYGFYLNSREIKDLLFEIEKAKKVIEENNDDDVVVRETTNIMTHQQNLLSHKILNNSLSSKNEVVWIFQGKVLTIKSKRKFNKTLSEICANVYDRTPIFHNELANRHKISSPIHTAKRNYFKALASDWVKPQLGFPENRYPPEKTIYLSLLESNGIKLYTDSNSGLIINEANNFHFLWAASIDFLNSAKVSRRRISEFVDILDKRPFKLKQGLIDFWVPSFLFVKRDDFALFENKKGYIPDITYEVLELIGKESKDFEIKSFDIEGVRLNLFNSYRLFLKLSSKDKLSNKAFIETVKPFLTFYRDLPEFSKKTMRLSAEAVQIREAIIRSRDPEQTFFEDFPSALGFTANELQNTEEGLQKFSTNLQNAIRELRGSYDELISRVELFIQDELIGEEMPFEGYKASLQIRFKQLKRHLLIPHQKRLVQRIDSEIDDKKAWLNSIVQAILGTSLEKIGDEEEMLLYDKFKSLILELDTLTALSKTNFSEDTENVFGLEISTFSAGLSKALIRVPKIKDKEVTILQKELSKLLSKDRTINLAAVTSLLKQLLDK
jgi:hypothetical protein